MAELNEPLEKLVRSNLTLSLLRSDVRYLRTGRGNILGGEVYHVAPDQGTLNFGYAPSMVLGGSPVEGIMNFNQYGYTLVELSSGDKYAIHARSETLPADLTAYQVVSKQEYVDRVRELCTK